MMTISTALATLCILFITTQHRDKLYTGGPRYMRSFYLRIRVFGIEKYSPKFIICDFLYIPRLYAIFNEIY
jgi:hypothetical protein